MGDMHSCTKENLNKIRSDVIYQRQETDARRRKPRFCTEKTLHEKWNVSPVDMTPKLYFVNNTTRKVTRRINTKTNQLIKKTPGGLKLPKLHSDVLVKDDEKRQKYQLEAGHKMLLRFRVDSANTDRRKSLKTGFFSKDVFSAPRPHHFRDDIHRILDNASELGKADFKVTQENDPRNMYFKNYTVRNLQNPELSTSTKNISRFTRDDEGQQFVTFRPKDPQFEINLFHEKPCYRKDRDPKDVLYEKIAMKKNLPISNNEFQLLRPNISDNTTEDWLEITRTGSRHKCTHPS